MIGDPNTPRRKAVAEQERLAFAKETKSLCAAHEAELAWHHGAYGELANENARLSAALAELEADATWRGD